MARLYCGEVVESSRGQVLTCGHCGRELSVVVMTTAQASMAPAALAMLRGCGHLAALAGSTWFLRCAGDQHNRMMPVLAAVKEQATAEPAVLPPEQAAALRKLGAAGAVARAEASLKGKR